MMWREATRTIGRENTVSDTRAACGCSSYPTVCQGSTHFRSTMARSDSLTSHLQPGTGRRLREPEPGRERELRLVLAGQHRTGLAQRVLVAHDDGASAPARAGEPGSLNPRKGDRALHDPIELGTRTLVQISQRFVRADQQLSRDAM